MPRGDKELSGDEFSDEDDDDDDSESEPAIQPTTSVSVVRAPCSCSADFAASACFSVALGPQELADARGGADVVVLSALVVETGVLGGEVRREEEVVFDGPSWLQKLFSTFLGIEPPGV